MNQHQCRRRQRISRKKAQKAQKKNAFAFFAPSAPFRGNEISSRHGAGGARN
jgi:hypothetical protein